MQRIWSLKVTPQVEQSCREYTGGGICVFLIRLAQTGQWEGALTKPLLQTSKIILPDFLQNSEFYRQKIGTPSLQAVSVQLGAHCRSATRALPWRRQLLLMMLAMYIACPLHDFSSSFIF